MNRKAEQEARNFSMNPNVKKVSSVEDLRTFSTVTELFDVNELRRKANQSVEMGAVPLDYPLGLEEACALLNAALATEILCVLRYRHHQIVAKGIHFIPIAEEFEEHAKSEEMHMFLIAERINQLGGNPDFNPATIPARSATEYGQATSLRAMVQDDLVAERVAIDVYRKLINWFGAGDPTTRRMLESILAEEEEHANDLADILAIDLDTH